MARTIDTLKLIVELGCVSVSAETLVAKLPGVSRKSMFGRIAPLIVHKLVTAKRVRGVRTIAISYSITDKGLKQLASGAKTITGVHVGPPTPRKGTFRSDIWKALRMKRRGTAPELVEIAGNVKNHAELQKAVDHTRRYLNSLESGGIVTRAAQRAEGFAPSSNGFITYQLVRDLGPLAPMWSKEKGLFDPNAKERIASTAKKKERLA